MHKENNIPVYAGDRGRCCRLCVRACVLDHTKLVGFSLQGNALREIRFHSFLERTSIIKDKNNSEI